MRHLVEATDTLSEHVIQEVSIEFSCGDIVFTLHDGRRIVMHQKTLMDLISIHPLK